MILTALLIVRKDLRYHCSFRNAGFMQSILLGLLLIFLFSLSLKIGERMTGQAAAAIFWMATCFCQVLIFNGLYSQEESNGQRVALLLAPIHVQSIWLGKALAGFCLLLIAQAIFLPAILIFLNQHIVSSFFWGALALVLVDIGIVSLGSLLGALSQGQSSRESLFSILIFPLLIPILLCGIKTLAAVFTQDSSPDDSSSWVAMALAFDAIFFSASAVLFPFLFSAEE